LSAVGNTAPQGREELFFEKIQLTPKHPLLGRKWENKVSSAVFERIIEKDVDISRICADNG